MRKLFTFSLIVMLLSVASLVFSQVPADQVTIVIEGGASNIGSLETTINGDVDGAGNRINPNRVYLLKKNTVYIQQSRIEFGGQDDSTATLNIIGESGGNLPVILQQPPAGVERFNNKVHGSLTIKNVFYPCTNLSGGSQELFIFYRSDIRVVAENLITDYALRSAPFHFRNVKGKMSLFLKNCYFRDNTQFANSWNHGIYVRGDNGEPFDSLWVENVTIANCGMPLFGKFNPVNFFYCNHNTFVNTCKYPIWHEQFKEAYIANNLFINANWEGECRSTWETQMSNDTIPNGLIGIDPIVPALWKWDPAPAMEDIKFLASNNLSHRSPYFDSYYTGGWNNLGFGKPISNRAWGSVTADMLPIPVENIPVPLIGIVAQGVIDQYVNIIALDNYDMTIDPLLVTKGMKSQEMCDQFIKFARTNYGVADASETWDKSLMYFGDANPATVPGIEVEDGTGFTKISDLIEDFSYTSDLRSKIDGKPLGALHWWANEMDTWDSDAALEQVKSYYESVISQVADEHNEMVPAAYNLNQNYPNPFNPATQIEFSLSEKAHVTLSVYNMLGQRVKTLVDQPVQAGIHNVAWNGTNELGETVSNGIYFYRLTSDLGVKTMKMLLMK